MNDTLQHTRQLDLKVATQLLKNFGSIVGTKAISGEVARDIAGEVQRAISAEMASRVFFVMASDADVYRPEDADGRRVQQFGEKGRGTFPRGDFRH